MGDDDQPRVRACARYDRLGIVSRPFPQCCCFSSTVHKLKCLNVTFQRFPDNLLLIVFYTDLDPNCQPCRPPWTDAPPPGAPPLPICTWMATTTFAPATIVSTVTLVVSSTAPTPSAAALADPTVNAISPGVIAGIVIGAVAVVLLAVWIALWIRKSQPRQINHPFIVQVPTRQKQEPTFAQYAHPAAYFESYSSDRN